MGKPDVLVLTNTPNNTTPSTKRSRPEDSPDVTATLDSINKQASIHREVQAVYESLQFSQQQVGILTAENTVLRESVRSLTEGSNQLGGKLRC